jgi:hypothetical protein
MSNYLRPFAFFWSANADDNDPPPAVSSRMRSLDSDIGSMALRNRRLREKMDDADRRRVRERMATSPEQAWLDRMMPADKAEAFLRARGKL